MELLIHFAWGALGGFIRSIMLGKGIISLPSIRQEKGHSKHLNLGIGAPALIGGLAGLLAPWAFGVNCVFSALSGYVGGDMIESILDQTVIKRKGNGKKLD